MQTILRSLAAVLAGTMLGSLVNILLVNIGPMLIPLPEGADVSSFDSLRDSIEEFGPINFLFPFLGHALGTLAGAFVAAKLAPAKKLLFTFLIAVIFLAGGIAMVNMIGGPIWFNALDLIFAYLPMGFLGAKLAGSNRSRTDAD